MLVTLLKILGVTVLTLFCLLAALALLFLFFPISYRMYGMREPERMEAWLKARWLFGIFRLDYRYPRPGVIRIKALWLTLYDSGEEKKPQDRQKKKNSKENGKEGDMSPPQDTIGTSVRPAPEMETPDEGGGKAEDRAAEPHSGEQDSTVSARETLFGRIRRWILEKFKKIKYTFHKICDKIKHILENYQYYRALLNEADTRELFAHAKKRLGRVWKSIRPRKVRANVRFGTGSPDTTGYLLGVCGMLSPFLGNHIIVTPDFEEAVLNGEIYASGRVTLFIILLNGLKLLTDRRLKLFIRKLKKTG